MKNKVYALVIILIFIITVAVFFYSYLIKEHQAEVLPEGFMSSDDPRCIFESDETTQKNALEKNDPDLCVCIENEINRKMCRQNVVDISLYNQAVEYLDSTVCEEISSDNIKTSCQSVVASGLAQDKNYEK